MPTTITKSVGSAGGRDYATLNAFIAAIPADLVAADEQWIGELYNDSEFAVGAVTLSLPAKTTDATRNIIIRAAAGHSFKDHANKLTNPLRYDQAVGVGIQGSGGAVLQILSDYVTIEGLQFLATGGPGSNGISQASTNAPNVTVKNCIFKNNSSATGSAGLNLYNGTGINCVSENTAGGTAIMSNGGGAKFINCTAFQSGSGTGFGYRGNYDSPLYRNCAAFGFNTNFRSGTSGSSNYNASSQASPPGANSLASLTASGQLENVSSSAALDARVKAGAALINAGVRENTYTADLDIVGSARSTSTPTIGAWEYAAGASTVQQDYSATRSIIASVQQDFAAARTIGDGVQQDFAGTRIILGPAGVSLNVDPDHVLRNNTGSIWASTEFKLSFSRADTDAFVVNKTVTTNASGLLGVVTDAALTAGVAYDIKIKRTAVPADMGILTATAA